ncbi:MAG: hypothetical protein AB1846_07420 [Chloroflexota bacterium]
MTQPEKQSHPSPYRSFLLRLWMEDARSKTPWRIVLIDIQTGSRRGFVDFTKLAEFLEGELPDEQDPGSQSAGEPHS